REEIKNLLGEKKGLFDNLEAFTKGINLEEKYYRQSLDRYPRKRLESKTTKNREREYTHFPSSCKACGLCVEVCPTKALSWSKTDLNYFGRNVPVVDIEKCIACKTCEQICPDIAIRVIKKR
ncbi:MAG: 4Fe-4S binding protein, partial [bacterium]|nr:4Fe-4S binding protein [bacterium]